MAIHPDLLEILACPVCKTPIEVVKGGRFGGAFELVFGPHRVRLSRKPPDEFLDRLRVAKDKTEFDAFMAERRNRPDTGQTHA